jgi:3-dehydroquinate dehydratase/shikimate dehydrogenase
VKYSSQATIVNTCSPIVNQTCTICHHVLENRDMTLLVASVAVDCVAEIELQAKRAWAGGADAVELRLDTFSGSVDELATFLHAHQNRQWIITIRSIAEGGGSTDEPLERARKLAAIVGDNQAFVDFEYVDWSAGDVRAKFARFCDVEGTSRLILSTHDFSGRVPTLLESETTKSLGEKVICFKMAYRANGIGDSFAALDQLHALADMERPASKCTTIAMGEEGLWTRVLAKKLGAFASYCSLGDETAAGQLTLDEMVNRYRWHSINSETRVFGVIGDPVAHSMSPMLFNHWFDTAEINAVYFPLNVCGSFDELARFLDDCRMRDWLHIGGFSVTIPHKTSALQWVGDCADPIAKSIGAVNTLSFRDGEVTAHNTDRDAAVSAMIDGLGVTKGECSHMTIDVLGAGGVARAVMHGIHELGCKMTVYGRTIERTQSLAKLFDARARSWDRRVDRSGDVVINCTNLGMWPAVDDTPLPAESLRGCQLVYDMVYNPIETQLLCDAKRAGLCTISGLEMFLRQAAMQFQLWTGQSPDMNNAKSIIESELARRKQGQ